MSEQPYFEQPLPKMDDIDALKAAESSFNRPRWPLWLAMAGICLAAFFTLQVKQAQQIELLLPPQPIEVASITEEVAAPEIMIDGQAYLSNFMADENAVLGEFSGMRYDSSRYLNLDEAKAMLEYDDSNAPLWVRYYESEGFVEQYAETYMDDTPCTWSDNPVLATEIVAIRYDSAEAAEMSFFAESLSLGVEVDDNTLLYQYPYRDHYDTLNDHFDRVTGRALDCVTRPEMISWISADAIKDDVIYYVRTTVAMDEHDPAVIEQIEQDMLTFIQDEWQQEKAAESAYECDEGYYH